CACGDGGMGIGGCGRVESPADAGLLSPEFAAGIRRVKGAKKLGIRLGNWLSANEARALWQSPDAETLKGKRDRAIIAVLLGCGLRRRELANLTFDHFQRREDHWATRGRRHVDGAHKRHAARWCHQSAVSESVSALCVRCVDGAAVSASAV